MCVMKDEHDLCVHTARTSPKVMFLCIASLIRQLVWYSEILKYTLHDLSIKAAYMCVNRLTSSLFILDLAHYFASKKLSDWELLIGTFPLVSQRKWDFYTIYCFPALFMQIILRTSRQKYWKLWSTRSFHMEVLGIHSNFAILNQLLFQQTVQHAASYWLSFEAYAWYDLPTEITFELAGILKMNSETIEWISFRFVFKTFGVCTSRNCEQISEHDTPGFLRDVCRRLFSGNR